MCHQDLEKNHETKFVLKKALGNNWIRFVTACDINGMRHEFSLSKFNKDAENVYLGWRRLEKTFWSILK